MTKINVILVGEDVKWKGEVAHFLESKHTIDIIEKAPSSSTVRTTVKKLVPSIAVVLLEDGLEKDDVDTTVHLVDQGIKVIFVVPREHSKKWIEVAYATGATDYVVKEDLEQIETAIIDAYFDRSPIRHQVAERVRRELCRLKLVEKDYEKLKLTATLTPMEWKILSFIAEGKTQGEISEKLYISKHTVKSHVSNLLKKLGESNSRKAAQRLKDKGLL